MANILVQAAVFVGSVVGLAFGARGVVDATVALARRVGLSDVVVGLTVVAVGTSAPELVVTTDAALDGLGDVAVGNVVGSNIYNVAVVLGTVAVIREIPIERSLLHRDGAALLVSTLLLAGVLFDSTVSRLEGGVLAVTFVAYTGYLLWNARSSTPTPAAEARPPSPVPVRVATRGEFGVRDAVVLVVGLAVVLASGHLLVSSATVIAESAGLSDAIIGGTIVAAGTATPELAVSLVALRRGSQGLSVGNIIGSNVFNALLALGVGAMVRPLSVSPAVLKMVAWLVAIVVVAVGLLWSGRRLSRGEGVLFVLSEAARWIVGILGFFG